MDLPRCGTPNDSSHPLHTCQRSVFAPTSTEHDQLRSTLLPAAQTSKVALNHKKKNIKRPVARRDSAGKTTILTPFYRQKVEINFLTINLRQTLTACFC
jgi:hypothetical protein